jgi:hypothetical protein
MELHLPFTITPQPDDATCGPSCLHAVYRYYGDDLPLAQVVEEVHTIPGGGTLAVMLGCHALRRGYRADLFTYNLMVFDPTWFADRTVDIAAKLAAQAEVKLDQPRLQQATPAYLEFLQLGGRIRFEDLTASLIRKYVNRGDPIITGLSSTYLYRAAREYGETTMVDDDIRGEPSGHFVVLCGYDRAEKRVMIADPYRQSFPGGEHHYPVTTNRVLIAIMLGVITYDANLLIIRPPVRT